MHGISFLKDVSFMMQDDTPKILKRIRFYFSISSYKFVIERSFSSIMVGGYKKRSVASSFVILFNFTIIENIFDWGFHLQYSFIKKILVALIIYFTIIDLFFFKDIEYVSANYNVWYSKHLYIFLNFI